MMKNRGFVLHLIGYGKRSSTTPGFTLIETVIALAILGIGLTVIIELFSGGLRLARTSEEYTKAMNFARMKLEEIISQQKIEEGTDEGSIVLDIDKVGLDAFLQQFV